MFCLQGGRVTQVRGLCYPSARGTSARRLPQHISSFQEFITGGRGGGGGRGRNVNPGTRVTLAEYKKSKILNVGETNELGLSIVLIHILYSISFDMSNIERLLRRISIAIFVDTVAKIIDCRIVYSFTVKLIPN